MRIKPVVEGHGEVSAVPELLRRLCFEAEVYDVQVLSAIRAHRTDFSDYNKLQRWIGLAKLEQPDAIVIIFDADDDCPVTTAQAVADWAKAISIPIPCEVVVANREYEAWFLGSIESLRGLRGIHNDAAFDQDPEQPRDAKGRLSNLMANSRTYSETADQTPLTSQMDFSSAHQKCRSFRRMVNALGKLITSSGRPLPAWPPQEWVP